MPECETTQPVQNRFRGSFVGEVAVAVDLLQVHAGPQDPGGPVADSPFPDELAQQFSFPSENRPVEAFEGDDLRHVLLLVVSPDVGRDVVEAFLHGLGDSRGNPRLFCEGGQFRANGLQDRQPPLGGELFLGQLGLLVVAAVTALGGPRDHLGQQRPLHRHPDHDREGGDKDHLVAVGER